MSLPNDETRTGVVPLPVKDVTGACITQLKAPPSARVDEGFHVPPDLLGHLLIPQADERIFLKLYVSERILDAGKLEISSTDLFPNYQGRIFEIEQDGVRQLLLVGVPNDFHYEATSSPSFPFFVYIPPSPQDTPQDHKKLYPKLYANTKPEDIPLFYKEVASYPYSWDWLFFQLFTNMYRLSYQMRKANKQYVIVVPLIKSFSDGMGLLNSGAMLQRCLVGIQKFYFDEKLQPGTYLLEDVQHVTMASFSIGNSILSQFILQNRELPFFRDRIRDLVVLDPPFGNPKNRSPIIDSIIGIMRTNKTKSVFVYTQDPYYLQPLVDTFVKPKGIAFDLQKDKIFADPKVPHVFFAYLEARLFREGIQDPLIKTVHNTFPNLFINNAARRSSLDFTTIDGKRYPAYNFLMWAPGR